jgi:hypothetical protein
MSETISEKTMPMQGYLTGLDVQATSWTDTGNFGVTPNHRSWGHLAYQTRQNTILIPLDYPRGFDDLPNPELWIAAFNAMISDMPKNVSGINWTKTPEFNETEVGGTGDVHHTMTDMRFTPTEIQTEIDERLGYVIERTVYGWWDMLGMEVDTKRPAVVDLPGNENKEIVFTQNYRGGIVLAFEPSECMRYVNKAQIIYNVMPKDGIESIGQRVLTGAKEQVVHTITWTGTAVRDKGALQVAKTVLDAMRANTVIADNRSAIVSGIADELKELKDGMLASLQKESEKQLEG